MKIIRKKILLTVAVLFLVFGIIVAIANPFRVKKQVKELFKMNKALQEEGCYMADFEFRLVGFGYYLDKGQYRKALTMLSDYHTKLSNKEGLIKIPEFINKQEEIDFYLNLQNPKTGAFINETAPFCTYYEVSKNVIDHIVSLIDSTKAPLRLKYPLTFLDSINTPEKLTAHLDDISYVGWLASQFPQTTFHFARNILSATRFDNTLEANNLYVFSPEWKHAMLKWMNDFQDTTSGMWGPKNKRTKELRTFDLNNTASILKNFRDKEGDDLYEEFPLKYGNKLFKSAVKQLTEPFPGEDDLDEIHEWNLRQAKGIAMLLRYLWKDASNENKVNAEKIISRNIDICFKNYYVEEEGAFSYYPNSKKASPDGNTNLIFNEIGAFSYKKQTKLWGNPAENAKNVGELILNKIKTTDLDVARNISDINSLRVYTSKPDYEHLTDGVWAIFYPKETRVLDIMELVPNIVQWIETSSLSMGNWTSMAYLNSTYSKLHIKRPLILRDELLLKEMNGKIEESSELFLVGFDKLQIPRCIIQYKQAEG